MEIRQFQEGDRPCVLQLHRQAVEPEYKVNYRHGGYGLVENHFKEGVNPTSAFVAESAGQVVGVLRFEKAYHPRIDDIHLANIFYESKIERLSVAYRLANSRPLARFSDGSVMLSGHGDPRSLITYAERDEAYYRHPLQRYPDAESGDRFISIKNKKDIVFVTDLAIDPAYQHRGLGFDLASVALQQVVEAGAPAIFTQFVENNRLVEKICERLGFRKILGWGDRYGDRGGQLLMGYVVGGVP